MLNIVLTKEQTENLIGVKISNIDDIGYTVKDGDKIELPTEVGSTVIVDVLDSDLSDENKLTLVYESEEITVSV